MSFTIEQICALSTQGFTPEQIRAFSNAYQQPVQPVQQMPQVQPVQQTPQVQQVQQMPVQPVQQMPQVQQVQQMPVQPVQQVQPVQPVQQMPQTGASGAADTSTQMLNLVKAMQEQALAGAAGHYKQPTAVDASLDVLGRGDKN